MISAGLGVNPVKRKRQVSNQFGDLVKLTFEIQISIVFELLREAIDLPSRFLLYQIGSNLFNQLTLWVR